MASNPGRRREYRNLGVNATDAQGNPIIIYPEVRIGATGPTGLRGPKGPGGKGGATGATGATGVAGIHNENALRDATGCHPAASIDVTVSWAGASNEVFQVADDTSQECFDRVNDIFQDTHEITGAWTFANDVKIAAGKDLDCATNGAYFKPRRLSQSAQPTPDPGELLAWRDTDDNKTYLVYNDPDVGVRKVEMI